jgi:hypothetical protein
MRMTVVVLSRLDVTLGDCTASLVARSAILRNHGRALYVTIV